MRCVSRWLAVLLVLVLGSQPGWGQTDAQKTEVWVTPRLWYSNIHRTDDNINTAGVLDGTKTVDATQPTYAGTVTVKPANMGGVSFNLSAFYGGYDARLGVYRVTTPSYLGDRKGSRTEIDGVVQIPLGTGAGGSFWSFGGRYLHNDVNEEARNPSGNIYDNKLNIQAFLGQVGIGTSTTINASGSQRLFGGVTLLGGTRMFDLELQILNPQRRVLFQTTDSQKALVSAVDANFGYAIQVAPWGILSMRYRIQLYSLMDNSAKVVGHDMQFGPEINFSIKLN